MGESSNGVGNSRVVYAYVAALLFGQLGVSGDLWVAFCSRSTHQVFFGGRKKRLALPAASISRLLNSEQKSAIKLERRNDYTVFTTEISSLWKDSFHFT